jgi:NTE family protein
MPDMSLMPDHSQVGEPSPEHARPIRNGRSRIGLALGAGAFRGAAHVGVIRALEREDIPIDLVVGCSAGALVGLMYCGGFSTSYMRTGIQRLNPDNVFSRSPGRDGFIDMAPLREILEELMDPETTIESLPRRFACVAADALTGELVVLSKGPAIPAVQASMAIPGLVRPVVHEGRQLVDGSVVLPIPVSPARALGANRVIAVDVFMPRHGKKIARHPAESLSHCFDMALRRIADIEMRGADVPIQPDLRGIPPGLDRSEELLAAGELAANPVAHRIRQEWLSCTN